MDAEFLAELRGALDRVADVRLLASDEAEMIQNRVAERFGLPAQSCWWWERLPAPSMSIAYGQGDGLDAVLAAVPAGTSEAYLLLSGDEPPPWPCVHGPVGGLVRLLRELPFMEFLVVDDSMDWILFDTHHNALVGHGVGLRVPAMGR
jgi:hypothetical protein